MGWIGRSCGVYGVTGSKGGSLEQAQGYTHSERICIFWKETYLFFIAHSGGSKECRLCIHSHFYNYNMFGCGYLKNMKVMFLDLFALVPLGFKDRIERGT